MASNGVTLDKVSIEINASAEKASSNISQLTQTLSELRSATKGGFNNLSKLAASLNELKTASSNLQEVSNNLNSLTSVSNVFKELSEISNPKGLEKAISNIEKIPSAFAKITPNALENIARVSSQLSDAITPLANKFAAISRGYGSMSQMADRYGVSVSKVREYTKQATNYTKMFSSVLSTVNKGFKNVQKSNESFFKQLSRNASSVISKVKQIGLSLLGTRTIFTATRKAVSEYMALDAELTWKITNNWRALGAQLAPVIENVIWLFKQFIRVIYSIILALTGIDLISRANEKAMKGWGKAAKDTLGNLQKFDDLNVVEFPKSSGSGDDNRLIELDTIDLSPIQRVIDWVRKLRDEIKEAWNSGAWYGVGEVLAEGLNAAIESINFDWIEDKFANIAKKFGDFLHGVIDNFDWETFGVQLTRQLSLIPRLIITALNEIPWEDIGRGLNRALSTFDPAFLIDSILGSVNTLILGLQSAFQKIDGKIIGKKISDAVISVFNNFNELLTKIDWQALGTKLREVIENIDWETIWNNVVEAFKNAFNGIGGFFDGLFNTNGSGGIMAGLFGGALAIKEAPAVMDFIEKTSDKVSGLKTAFDLLGKNTLTTDTISQISGVSKPLLDVFGSLGSSLPIIGAVVGGIILVGTAFADLYKNNEEFRKTVDDLFASIKETVLPIIDTVIQTIKDLWKNVIVPLFKLLVDIVKPFVEAIVDIIAVLWENALKPVVKVLTEIYKAVMPPLIDILNKCIDVLSWVWNKWLQPIVKFISGTVVATIKLLTGDVDGAMESMSGAFLHLIEAGKNLWSKIKEIFKKIADSIKEKIDNIKADWKNFWDNITTLPKKMLQGLINLINSVIDKINNKLSINLGSKTVKLLETLGVKNISEGKYQLFSIPKIPSLDVGTNEVPYEGMYHLHPGEAVIPKKYNPALSGGTNEETNKRLDTLIDVLSNLDTTTIVNIGNRELYKQQQHYTKRQNDKYGTDVNL